MRAAEDRFTPSVVARAPGCRRLLEGSAVRADEHAGDGARHELHFEIANLNGGVVRAPRVIAEDARFLRQHLGRLVQLDAVAQALLPQTLGRGPQPAIAAAVDQRRALVEDETSLSRGRRRPVDESDRILHGEAIEAGHQIDVLQLVTEGLEIGDRTAPRVIRVGNEAGDRRLLSRPSAIEQRQF